MKLKLKWIAIAFLIVINLNFAHAQTTQVFQLNNGKDDVEVRTSNGIVNFTSSDLELHGKDGSIPQISYLRFQNVKLPTDIVIQSVRLIFTLYNSTSLSSTLNVFGEIGNSAAFTTAVNSYSNRNYNNPIIWNTVSSGDRNSVHKSPDLKSLFPNIASTTSIGFKITGNEVGNFNVYSYNQSNSSKRPQLEVVYTTPFVPALGIQFNCNVSNIVVGSKHKFSANLLPSNATNKTFIWSSSNNAVVSVSSIGDVTALSPGAAYINVATQDGEYSNYCPILVTAIPNSVIYKWSGALTPTSIKINAKLTNNTLMARALVSTNQDLTNPIYSTSIPVNTSTNRMGTFQVNGLQPNTQYFYGIESNGVIDYNPNSIGKFKTPSNGAHSYSFAAGSCNSDSGRPVWQKIKDKNPLFMLELGDIHYVNPRSLNASRKAYEDKVLNVPNTKNLFNVTPIAHTWDDHDFAGNDSNTNSTNKNGAKQAYREYIPHYPFGETVVNPAIYQSFVIGRVRYIMMDTRSEKNSSQLISDAQTEWFKRESRAAKANNEIIAWVTSYGLTSSSSDSWGGNLNYRTKRNAIFDFLIKENINNLFIISGDAHSAGIDDGQNTDCFDVISSNNCPRSNNSTNPRYPLVHAAPLYNDGLSTKGVITNILPMTNATSTGQYSKIDVIDNGGDIIKICFTVYRVNNSGIETTLGNYCFERNLNVTAGI